MSRRNVIVTNTTAPAQTQVRGANLNEVRVEIRVIFGDQVQLEELLPLLAKAEHEAKQRVWSHVRKHPHTFTPRVEDWLNQTCGVCFATREEGRHTEL